MRMKSIDKVQSLCVVLLLFMVLLHVSAVSSSASSNIIASVVRRSSQQRKRDIDNFIQIRTNKPHHHAIWYHRGILRNPTTGSEIAGIEGVEICKALPTAFTTATLHDNVPHIHNHSVTTDHHTHPHHGYFGGSYLTKKIFAYVQVGNRSQELTSFRLQPQAPQRSLQPTTEMYELITLYSHPHEDKVSSIIEWPGGRKLFGHKLSFRSAATASQVTQAGFRSTGKDMVAVDHIVSGKKKTPLWNKWISFSSSTEHIRGRSHETLFLDAAKPHTVLRALSSLGLLPRTQPQHANDIPHYDAKMAYRRFGEGPYWFFPGKPCLVEMESFRLSSWTQLPKHTSTLLQRLAPSFHSPEACSLQEFENSEDRWVQFKPWYQQIPFFSSTKKKK